MGRHKTISDDDVLRIARDVFRARGHTATTREIADVAGVSEAVLYQRFGSKDDLFFASMRPSGPDLEEILGPADPPADAQAYLRRAAVRAGQYFAAVIPLALRVMTHPSFDPAAMSRAQPMGSLVLREALALRLEKLLKRGAIATPSAAAAAKLLVSLAHDWGLAAAFRREPPARRVRDLEEMVDVVWAGLKPA